MSARRASPAPARFASAADRLHQEAVAVAGLDDFGPPDYQEGLDVLLAALDADCPLTDAGRMAVWDDLTVTLVARLRAADGLTRRSPTPIIAPIVITGVPRTGTTALHKLMSLDPQFQGLNRWLADAPMPRPPLASWPGNPCFEETTSRLAERYTSTPGLRSIHLEVASEVDECLQLLKQGMTSIRFGARAGVPTYDTWLRTADKWPSYDWYRKNLALIGVGDSRRWLLKNPSHILDLDLLFAAFPDAVLVQTHRDLMSAIPSFCSLLATVRTTYESDVHLAEIGARELQLWGEGLQRAMVARLRWTRVIDVHHEDFSRDPIAVVSGIYDQAGLAFTDQVRLDMQARVRADPERRLGVHAYDPDDFGVTRRGVESAFGDYADVVNRRRL